MYLCKATSFVRLFTIYVHKHSETGLRDNSLQFYTLLVYLCEWYLFLYKVFCRANNSIKYLSIVASQRKCSHNLSHCQSNNNMIKYVFLFRTCFEFYTMWVIPYACSMDF